jgi:lipoate-protein ligase A
MVHPSVYNWRFLNTHFGNAFFNMAADEAIVHAVAKGADPVFRVYAWHPPAISFGYAQHVGREIDPEKCRQKHIDIVRRSTGGRAVLHWNELTYSVICKIDDPSMGGNIQEAYRNISSGLLAGLALLNISATLESRRQAQPSPRGKELTAPCFTSTAQYEITYQGRKLIGSAQQRIGSVLLQHGSLLLGPEHKQMIDLLPAGKEILRDRFQYELEQYTTSLAEIFRPDISFDTLAQALRQGMLNTFPIAFADGDLTVEEHAETQRLIVEKYSTRGWNFKH